MTTVTVMWTLIVFLFYHGVAARVKRESIPESHPPQRSSDITECLSNDDCAVDRACVSQRCEDPCLTFCGNNTYCQMAKHFPMCFCYPGYIGNPFEECQKPGIAECIINDDCSVDRMCISQRCRDPCQTLCGDNTICQMTRHFPVCSCQTGYIGNPIEGCRKPDSPCINNWTVDNTKVEKKKKYYVETSQKLTWIQAFDYCQRQNRQLASITSKEENDKIINTLTLLTQAGAGEMERVWIGGTGKDISKDDWKWISTGQPIEDYTNWHIGEPNGTDYNCLEYLMRNDEYMWASRECSADFPFICESLE